jgi:hypothetical protein
MALLCAPPPCTEVHVGPGQALPQLQLARQSTRQRRRARPASAALRQQRGPAGDGAGPSERRPRTAGALRGGDGGVYGLSARRVPRWVAELGFSALMLAEHRNAAMPRHRRRRTTSSRDVDRRGRPSTVDAAAGAVAAGGSTTVGLEQLAAAAIATPTTSSTGDFSNAVHSTIFGTPSEPALSGLLSDSKSAQAAHRGRRWACERADSRTLSLRVAAHTWQVRRSARRRMMEHSLLTWADYVVVRLRFVQYSGFTIWVWKRHCISKRGKRAATAQLLVEFRLLRARQVFRQWMSWFVLTTIRRKRWQGMQRVSNARKLHRIMLAVHTWASVAAQRRRTVVAGLLRSSTRAMSTMCFVKMRVWTHFRTHRRSRRERFGNQLQLRLNGAGHINRIPALKAPPVSSTAVKLASLDSFIAWSCKRDSRDLLALQWRFARCGRQFLFGWHAHVEATKAAIHHCRRQLLLRAFRQFRWGTKWKRMQRATHEEIRQKKQAFVAQRQQLRMRINGVEEELQRHRQPAAHGRQALRRSGNQVEASTKLAEESQFRKERAARDEAARIQAEAELQSALAVSDSVAADSEEKEDLAPAEEQSGKGVDVIVATRIQRVWRGYLVRRNLASFRVATNVMQMRMELCQLDTEALIARKRSNSLFKRLDFDKTIAADADESVLSRWRAEQNAELVDKAILHQWRSEQTVLARKLITLDARRVELRTALASLAHSAVQQVNLHASNESSGPPVPQTDIVGAQHVDHHEMSDEAEGRSSRYTAVFERAADTVNGTDPHLAGVRRRQNEIAREMARIADHELDLQSQLRQKQEDFGTELANLQAQMEKRLQMANEHPLIAMLTQLCDAFGMALDAVAKARLRNTTIDAFMVLSHPVKMRKSRAHFLQQCNKRQFDQWRRYNAMMIGIRNLAHVRFRCCYTVFRRWGRAARQSRIYCTRGLRHEVKYRKQRLHLFSSWLRDAPFNAYIFGRYTVLTRWIEFVQRRVARREICRLHAAVRLLWRRRQAFLAIFLGLKPQHQDSLELGYVEKNMLADMRQWQYAMRNEASLLSDRHRAVNRREIQRTRTKGLQYMTARRRLRTFESNVEGRLQNERALVLAAFGHEEWHHQWAAIFHYRSSAVQSCFKRAHDWMERSARLQLTPAATELAPVLSDLVRPAVAMWLLRARLNILQLPPASCTQAGQPLLALIAGIAEEAGAL